MKHWYMIQTKQQEERLQFTVSSLLINQVVDESQ